MRLFVPIPPPRDALISGPEKLLVPIPGVLSEGRVFGKGDSRSTPDRVTARELTAVYLRRTCAGVMRRGNPD